jgi:hypothetical protein
LHPKLYKCIIFWNVKSTSNYSEKLKLAGIHTVTLYKVGAKARFWWLCAYVVHLRHMHMWWS